MHIIMTKPRLPRVLERKLPPHLLHYVYSFVAHEPSPKPAHSPQLQKELTRLQTGTKKTTMYLMGLDDFVLDKQ
jgi:hypothetical protein